jgi:hypothetical protein
MPGKDGLRHWAKQEWRPCCGRDSRSNTRRATSYHHNISLGEDVRFACIFVNRRCFRHSTPPMKALKTSSIPFDGLKTPVIVQLLILLTSLTYHLTNFFGLDIIAYNKT